MKNTKYIVVTGGVISGLGKGVVLASLGRLLNSKYKVVPIKCDGYLNVDPGTMNPTEHGEVFVLDDGGEVDLDFGHYERFLNIDCKKTWSITSGKVFQSLMEKERRGDFLGKTVQVIPHVTGEIRERIIEISKDENADIVIIEVGGTIGDLENLWFLEACRELERDLGRENIAFVHLGLVPVIDAQGQQKTKPLQQSVIHLRERGIFPDVIIGRSKERLQEHARAKLYYLCNVRKDAVISDPDLETVYELPLVFEDENLREFLEERLGLESCKDLSAWRKLVAAINGDQDKPQTEITIAIAGKYTNLADSYISVTEALKHAGANQNAKIIVKWVETSDIETLKQAEERLSGIDGIIVPGGFGTRGTEGKIKVIEYARTKGIPFLGLCYGLQLAIIEYARNVCRLDKANSTEIDSTTSHPVVDILPEQKTVTNKGGTMRLGNYTAQLKSGSIISKLYGSDVANERHRHRYEVNPDYHKVLGGKDLIFSGTSKNGKLVEFIELKGHPYFVATQSHPELKSRLERPAPLFMGLIEVALQNKNKNQKPVLKKTVKKYK